MIDFLFLCALSMVHITIPAVKFYVVLQVSVCAGVNDMAMWASFLCGVTAGPIYILIHYVMIRCKGKQVIRAEPHAVVQWLRHYARNRKVVGSIPDGVIEIFLT
jgi:hypothetical protein